VPSFDPVALQRTAQLAIGKVRSSSPYERALTHYDRAMIDLGSIAGLYEHEHELRAYCPRCSVRVRSIAKRCSQPCWFRFSTPSHIGKGDTQLPLTVRCRECGEVGRVQVRPIMPAWTNSNGWMAMR
jgi:hypothetical protein